MVLRPARLEVGHYDTRPLRVSLVIVRAMRARYAGRSDHTDAPGVRHQSETASSVRATPTSSVVRRSDLLPDQNRVIRGANGGVERARPRP
eukprot:COSAG05_NODE_1270_length_5316_cov_3.177688_6_plen_91_part_00